MDGTISSIALFGDYPFQSPKLSSYLSRYEKWFITGVFLENANVVMHQMAWPKNVTSNTCILLGKNAQMKVMSLSKPVTSLLYTSIEQGFPVPGV